MSGTGSSWGWSGLLSESAGKNRGSGRLSRRFCFGGADNTCSNRNGAECIDFAKGSADAETGADTGSCAGNSGPDGNHREKRKNLNNTGTSKVKKTVCFRSNAKKDNKTEEKKTEETSVAAENPRETYVIRPGDTLYQISLNRYGTVAAMEQICALNGISANEIIYPGQVIVLP
ncbi:MAG: LysM domain-containing protein [Ruminococcus sp.]|nr:LysM domain-containing protein [Ruminococcus sp.]